MIRVTFRWFRDSPCVRLRGRHPATGKLVDSTAQIPAEVFAAANIKHKSRTRRAVKRIEEVGIAYALDLERQENSPRPRTSTGNEMALSALWELYAKRSRSQLNEATIDRSRKYAAALIAFFDANETPPSAIGLGALEDFRDRRLKQGLSPATVFREVAFARQLLRWGLEHADETGITSLKVNTLPKIKGKRGIRPKYALTPEQFFAVYDATFQLKRRGDVLRRILAFGVCTRLRKTPLLACRGEFIDRERRWLDIPATLNKGRTDNYEPISLPLPQWALAVTEDLPRRGLLWPSFFGKAHRAADAEEMLAAIESISSNPTRDGLLVLLVGRYRIISECVANLKWSVIDLDHGIIRAARLRRRTADVQLSPADAARLRAFYRDRTSPYLFPSTHRDDSAISKQVVHWVMGRASAASGRKANAEPVPLEWIGTQLKRACLIAGVQPVTLHDLRRTGNSWLLSHKCEKHSAPVDEVIRERLLGHVPAMLRAAYNFVGDDLLRDAVERIDCIARHHLRKSSVVDLRATV